MPLEKKNAHLKGRKSVPEASAPSSSLMILWMVGLSNVSMPQSARGSRPPRKSLQGWDAVRPCRQGPAQLPIAKSAPASSALRRPDVSKHSALAGPQQEQPTPERVAQAG